MSKVKNVACISKECVACGSCLKACPLSLITIYKGMYAVVNEQACVGCGRCAKACPAAVILIASREECSSR